MLSRLHAFAMLALALIVGSVVPAFARDEIRIGMTQFPATFHPAINAMLAKSYVLNMTMRPITVYDQDWELVCMLCVTLPTIENGMAKPEPLPDGGEGVAVTYTIHPDATWGDGVPVTSKDVVFTWEVGRNEESGFSGLEGYRRVLGIDVVDDKTFTMHVDRLAFDYNANGIYVLPEHLEREAFAEPREYRYRTLYDTDTTNPGLYYGPYRITEVVSGSHVVLEPNPTWYGKKPYFKRIVVRTIENTAALEANLLSGAIDYVAGSLGFTIEQALSFEKRQGKNFEVLYKPGLIYEHIDVDLDNPILADRRVRQALMYAMNRKTLTEKLFGGEQPVAHSNINPLDWIYFDGAPHYSQDLDKAAALLEDAGWTMGGDGIRRNADGEKLSVPFMTTAGNKSRELVQQVLQADWKKAGIDPVIRNEPARVFFGETMTKRAFDGLGMYAWLSSPESVPISTLKTESIPSEANGWAGQNYPGYSNPEMDDLIDAITVELDRDKRAALWKEFQTLYATDLPALPLFFRAEPYFFPKWLKGVRPTGHLQTTTTWVEEWTATD